MFMKSLEPMPVDPAAPYGYVMTEGGPVRRAAPPQYAFKFHDFGARGQAPKDGEMVFKDGVYMGVIPKNGVYIGDEGGTIHPVKP